MKSKIFIPLVIFLILNAAFIMPAESAVELKPQATVRSYNGQFTVTAPDLLTASIIAKKAEDYKAKIDELFGEPGRWDNPASIILTSTQEVINDTEEKLWMLRLIKEGEVKTEANLFQNKIDDALLFQVAYFSIKDIAQRGAADNRAFLAGKEIAFWLLAGVVENVLPDNKPLFHDFIEKALKNENYFHLNQLFQFTGPFKTEKEKELFYRQSGSFLNYLLTLPDGREKVRRAIQNLWSKSNFTFSLRWEFRDVFSSVDDMEKKWVDFASQRSKRFIRLGTLTLAETKERLDTILVVEIPVMDRETIEQEIVTTDFGGLMKQRDRMTVALICRRKIVELTKLMLRSKKEYHPIIQKYIESLQAIVQKKRGSFRFHFRKAEKLRKKLEKLPYFKVE